MKTKLILGILLLSFNFTFAQLGDNMSIAKQKILDNYTNCRDCMNYETKYDSKTGNISEISFCGSISWKNAIFTTNNQTWNVNSSPILQDWGKLNGKTATYCHHYYFTNDKCTQIKTEYSGVSSSDLIDGYTKSLGFFKIDKYFFTKDAYQYSLIYQDEKLGAPVQEYKLSDWNTIPANVKSQIDALVDAETNKYDLTIMNPELYQSMQADLEQKLLQLIEENWEAYATKHLGKYTIWPRIFTWKSIKYEYKDIDKRHTIFETEVFEAPDTETLKFNWDWYSPLVVQGMEISYLAEIKPGVDFTYGAARAKVKGGEITYTAYVQDGLGANGYERLPVGDNLKVLSSEIIKQGDGKYHVIYLIGKAFGKPLLYFKVIEKK